MAGVMNRFIRYLPNVIFPRLSAKAERILFCQKPALSPEEAIRSDFARMGAEMRLAMEKAMPGMKRG